MLCERALYGQDAGHAVLCRLGIGRLFLRNIFNSYNHDYSLAPDEGSRRMRWGGVGWLRMRLYHPQSPRDSPSQRKRIHAESPPPS